MQSRVAVTVSSPPRIMRNAMPRSSARVAAGPSKSVFTRSDQKPTRGVVRRSSICASKYAVISAPVRARTASASAGSAAGRMMSSRHRSRSSRSSWGSPIIARNTVEGSGVAKSTWKSQLAARDDPVEQLVDELAHLGFEWRDRARVEPLGEEPSVPRVQWRIDLEWDEVMALADVDRLGRRREHLRVLQGPQRVGVAADPDGHLTGEPGDARDRALVAQPGVAGRGVVTGPGFDEEQARGSMSLTGDRLTCFEKPCNEARTNARVGITAVGGRASFGPEPGRIVDGWRDLGGYSPSRPATKNRRCDLERYSHWPWFRRSRWRSRRSGAGPAARSRPGQAPQRPQAGAAPSRTRSTGRPRTSACRARSSRSPGR